MTDTSPKKSEVRQPMKRSIYTEFILWTAMPPLDQRELGIETHGQFAKFYKVSPDTLTDWKKRPDFEQRVDAILKMWSVGKTPAVIHGIYRAAVKGNPMSQLLWLQYFKRFTPKTEVEETKRVEIGVNDIRHLIAALPEPLKSEHHANFRKLIEDAMRLRSAGQLENTALPEPARPEDRLRDAAGDDASDVSGKGADALPRRYPLSLRANMVGEISSHHREGAERRWQE